MTAETTYSELSTYALSGLPSASTGCLMVTTDSLTYPWADAKNWVAVRNFTKAKCGGPRLLLRKVYQTDECRITGWVILGSMD